MLGLSLGLSLGNPIFAPGGGYDPVEALGPKLLAYWRDNLGIDQSAGLVGAWLDTKGGFAPTQATAGFKPALGDGIEFDGTDDYLRIAYGTGTALPNGAAPFEILMLVRQDAPVSNSTARDVFAIGNTGNASCFVRRQIIDGANALRFFVGDGSALATATAVGDFSGWCVVRCRVTSTFAYASLNGLAEVRASVAPNISTSGNITFGTGRSTPAGFHDGAIAESAVINGSLTDDEWAAYLAYAKARKGIA